MQILLVKKLSHLAKFTYSTKRVSIFFTSTLLVLYLHLHIQLKQTYTTKQQGKKQVETLRNVNIRQQKGKELKRQKIISGSKSICYHE